MDIVSALLACSVYVDDNLVRAIASATSQNNPYFVVDVGDDPALTDFTVHPKTASEAMARTEEIVAKRGRPVFGLLPVNASWMGMFGRVTSDAFEPCINVSVATAMMSQFARECTASSVRDVRRAVPALRSCVLHKYEDAIELVDFERATSLELQSVEHRSNASIPWDAPIFPKSSSTWGSNCLLVTLKGGH